MIPQTVGAFVAFLGLVAPGIFYERRRERRRALSATSTFQEVAGIALSSLVLTSVSVALLLGLRAVFGSPFVDPIVWSKSGSTYFKDHLYAIALSALGELVIAFALAWLVDVLLTRTKTPSANLRKYSLWHQAFRTDKPDNTTPWVHVELTDGSAFYGLLAANTAVDEVDNREITLYGTAMERRDPPTADGKQGPSRAIGHWEYVIIRSSEIRYLKVQYQDDNGDLAPSRPHAARNAKLADESAV